MAINDVVWFAFLLIGAGPGVPDPDGSLLAWICDQHMGWGSSFWRQGLRCIRNFC